MALDLHCGDALRALDLPRRVLRTLRPRGVQRPRTPSAGDRRGRRGLRRCRRGDRRARAGVVDRAGRREDWDVRWGGFVAALPGESELLCGTFGKS